MFEVFEIVYFLILTDLLKVDALREHVNKVSLSLINPGRGGPMVEWCSSLVQEVGSSNIGGVKEVL